MNEWMNELLTSDSLNDFTLETNDRIFEGFTHGHVYFFIFGELLGWSDNSPIAEV